MLLLDVEIHLTLLGHFHNDVYSVLVSYAKSGLTKFKYEMKNRKGCANGLLLCILFFEINIILNEVLKSLLNLWKLIWMKIKYNLHQGWEDRVELQHYHYVM